MDISGSHTSTPGCDVPVEVAVEVGGMPMAIRETLALARGSIIAPNRLAGEPVDLLVSGRPPAGARLWSSMRSSGVPITEILGGTAAPAPLPATTASAPPGPGGPGEEAQFASFDQPADFAAAVPARGVQT